MIKITSGKYRSRVLEVPSYLEVPSKSIVRTGMMNALSTYLEGTVVLDLFGGSGALAIEALSRGAAFAYIGELELEGVKTIERNLSTLKESNARVIHGDYKEILNNYQDKYDVVFLDPPYKMKEVYKEVPEYLLKNDRLSENAIVVLEYEGEIETPKECFSRTKEYHYGRTKVLIMWR